MIWRRLKMNESKDRIIKRIEELTILLGGTMKKMLRSNSGGRQNKSIKIEYDVKETKG